MLLAVGEEAVAAPVQQPEGEGQRQPDQSEQSPRHRGGWAEGVMGTSGSTRKASKEKAQHQKGELEIAVNERGRGDTLRLSLGR